MNKKEILEGNKLIVEFMGGNMIKDIFNCHESTKTHNERCLHGLNISQSKYHSSWDWLMPVVEKMETLGITTRFGDKRCLSINHIKYDFEYDTEDDCNSNIEAVYTCVIKFIKWYNTKN